MGHQKLKIMCPTYLQPNYRIGVFGNVYLIGNGLNNNKRKLLARPIATMGVVECRYVGQCIMP